MAPTTFNVHSLRPSRRSQILKEFTLRLEELFDVSQAFYTRHTHLDVGTIIDDQLLLLQTLIIRPVERGESPLLGHDDLLATWELVPSTTESLDDDWLVDVFASDRHDHLTTGGSERQRVESS